MLNPRNSPILTRAPSPTEDSPLSMDRRSERSISINSVMQNILPRPVTSRFALSRREVFKSLANRIYHSSIYTGLYVIIAILSVVTIVLAFREDCITFVTLDVIINFALIIEVSLRFLALGKAFWKSTWNLFDLCITALCVATLVALLITRPLAHHEECHSRSEEFRNRENMADLILIVVRNVAQGVRIFVMMRKNKRSLLQRPTPLDISVEARGSDSDTASLLFRTVDAVPSSLPQNGAARVAWDDDDDDFL